MISLRYNKESDTWQYFKNPCIEKKAMTLEDVREVTQELETLCKEKSLFAVLILTYEASPAFDPLYKVHASSSPLAYVSYYDSFIELSNEELLSLCTKRFSLSPASCIAEDEYKTAYNIIKTNLKEGNSYQINYTFPITAQYEGDALSWFIEKVQKNVTPYSFYCETDEYSLCSFSPELFFTRSRKKAGYELTLKPMKGTLKRRAGYEKEDELALSQSVKNRAENLMITDMIRNDVSHIAITGTVSVPSLYETEVYTSVIQMTSTIKAKSNASLYETLCVLYPCASITGAPKIKSMEIIHEVEKTQRGVYTGAVGYVDNKGDAVFSIPIRTAVLTKKTKTLTYGAGSGIVWDSQCNEEYEECKIKASVLSSESDEKFYVFDSLLLEQGSLYLLDKHLNRLKNSVSFFYTCTSEDLENLFTAINEELYAAAKQNPAGLYKVRTLITKDLNHAVTLESISSQEHTLRLAIMKDTVYTKTPYFTHKTSFRNAYTGIKNQYAHADDVLLINENGEATETTRGNVLIQTPEGFFTPPLSSGLLAGTYREYLLETNQCCEKILYEKDIRSAQKVWMINSVRRKVLCTIL